MNSHQNDVAILYKSVIEDVIYQVRNDFLNMGLDEQVLFELQELWETKLIEARVLTSIDDTGITVPQLLGHHNIHHSHIPHSTQWNSNSLLYNSQSMRQGITSTHKRVASTELSSMSLSKQPKMSSNDPDENFTETTADNNIISTDSNAVLSNASANPHADDLLGSDLDDSEDDTDFQDIDNIILCQFEKVGHSKAKWRCIFKDIILHLNGIDYAAHRATGEFDWI